jgi:hypothetical protein
VGEPGRVNPPRKTPSFHTAWESQGGLTLQEKHLPSTRRGRAREG